MSRSFGLGVLVVLLGAGCGGGSTSKPNASPPVEQVRVTRTYTMPSSAMEPTIHCAQPGSGCEAAMADELVAQSLDSIPKRGDILVFNTPPLAEQRCGAGGTFVKRLIALPGESWEEKHGVIYINGEKLIESYVSSDRRDTGTSFPIRKIPSGTYFVMGDNRTQSCDSREWGPVPSANIIGAVVTIRRAGAVQPG